MCLPSAPTPPPPPPPMPAIAPPPPPPVLDSAEGVTKQGGNMAMGQGRSQLRIDRTISSTGSSGSGLNIPT